MTEATLTAPTNAEWCSMVAALLGITGTVPPDLAARIEWLRLHGSHSPVSAADEIRREKAAR